MLMKKTMLERESEWNICIWFQGVPQSDRMWRVQIFSCWIKAAEWTRVRQRWSSAWTSLTATPPAELEGSLWDDFWPFDRFILLNMFRNDCSVLCHCVPHRDPQKCDQPGITTLNLFSSFEVKREAKEEDRLVTSNKLHQGSTGHGWGRLSLSN